MNNQETLRVASHISMMNSMYGVTMTDAAVMYQAQLLSDLDFQAVLEGFETFNRTNKTSRPATPGQIRDIVQPPVTAKDDANEAASRIISAMSKFGYTNSDNAQAFIGELGWRAVELMGGWSRLCQDSESDQNGTLRAQLRDLCASTHARASAGKMHEPPKLPSAKTGFIESTKIKELVKSTKSKWDDDEPPF